MTTDRRAVWRGLVVVGVTGFVGSWPVLGISSVSDEELGSLRFGWQGDICTTWWIHAANFPYNGNGCIQEYPDLSVWCGYPCGHTVWRCCWDPEAGQCHDAEAHGAHCMQNDWRYWCLECGRHCDGTKANCCWYTEVGPRVGDYCYDNPSTGQHDCVNAGQARCDMIWCVMGERGRMLFCSF